MGRPVKSKQSYQNQVQSLKKKLAESEKSRKEVLDIMGEFHMTYLNYRYASLLKRIRYVFTGDM